MTEANAERLAAGLCRMRGAALKIGQMLSIQDESLMPPQLQAIFDRVRQGADIMPRKQLEAVLGDAHTGLGPDWESKFAAFDFQPMAAASIGQVHRASTHEGQEVAVKVQYPGVARSIDSDINNLARLMKLVNIVPKGLFLDKAHT